MKIYIRKNYRDICRVASDLIENQIRVKADSVLGLATGSTPIDVYKSLIEKCNNGLSFKDVITFNLDEYIGIESDDVNSYKHFMQENLFNHIDIDDENIHIPSGIAEDIDYECKYYEQKIASKGGVDLQLLGLGKNGHIGFNEPNLEFENITHVVELDESTRSANARFFGDIDSVPRRAITMGIKTIMKARRIILLASGEEKAEAVKGMINGKINPNLPASVLQLHQDVTILLDEDAARLLDDELREVI